VALFKREIQYIGAIWGIIENGHQPKKARVSQISMSVNEHIGAKTGDSAVFRD
jgi:hypothetical protein